MKSLSLSLVLVGLCSALSTHAQPSIFKPYTNPTDAEWNKRLEVYIYADKLATWWWLSTYHQVRDKMVTVPGWDVYALDEDFDTENALFVTNRRLKVSMVFYFTKVKLNEPDKLIRRRYLYQPDSPYLDEWNERLASLPYDEEKKEWTDAAHCAKIIKGTNDSSEVVYEVSIYLPKTIN
jgi:hypothetical protein